MTREEFEGLKKGDRVYLEEKGKRIEGKILARSNRILRACIEIYQEEQGRYQAIFADIKEMNLV